MIIPPGFANVQVVGVTPGGREWLTACGCVIEAWDPTDLDDVFTSYLVGEDWITNILADDYGVNAVRVVVGTSDPTSPITYEQTGNVVGSSGAGATPNTALLLTKQTNAGGRHGRGRGFFPGPTESTVGDDGHIVGDLAADPTPITTFWPDLFGFLNLGDAVLLHADEEHEPNEITTFGLSSLVATQRRRLRG